MDRPKLTREQRERFWPWVREESHKIIDEILDADTRLKEWYLNGGIITPMIKVEVGVEEETFRRTGATPLPAFDEAYDGNDDPPMSVPDGEFVNERFWCGCVRKSCWVPRCELHRGLEHDEEPERRGDLSS